MKTADILRVLERKHKEWLCVREMRCGAGYGTIESASIDLWVMNTKPSSGHEAISYEIKVSRADFLRDRKKAHGHRGARMFSDRFFYATPPGLISPDEIPPWAGLCEIREEQWWGISYIVTAPKLEKERPSWGFIVSLLRRAGDDG